MSKQVTEAFEKDASLAVALEVVPSSNLLRLPGRKAGKNSALISLPIRLSFLLHNQKILILIIYILVSIFPV